MTKPVDCYCGAEAHTNNYVGGFNDTSASVTCWGCGVAIGAGVERQLETAVLRWNALQARLTAGVAMKKELVMLSRHSNSSVASEAIVILDSIGPQSIMLRKGGPKGAICIASIMRANPYVEVDPTHHNSDRTRKLITEFLAS